MKIVLGIETSCDDTSICLLRGESKGYLVGKRPEILAHQSFSQELLLRKWGGVVPEIAARNHLDKLQPLLAECFSQAQISPKEVDIIGVTTHPGLLGPLLTGVNAAKTISLYYKKPIVSVNHLHAHLEAIHLTEEVKYPYLGLLISGGHSLFMKVKSATEFELLGTTIDDAAGEAFDKGGKLMGLGYPGGQIIDRLAKEGDAKAFNFPIGLRGSGDAQLSFSGTKTSLRTLLEKFPSLIHKDGNEHSQQLKDLCASYQNAIVEALALKLRFALEKSELETPHIVVGGGVACNSSIRETLKEKYRDVHFVQPKFCTDNGAMIANYTLIHADDAVPFPESLTLDAKNRAIKKGG